jgi:hypothetical protein
MLGNDPCFCIVSDDNITIAFNWGSFEYYNVINVRELAAGKKMNYTLLSQYITGAKRSSENRKKSIGRGKIIGQ